MALNNIFQNELIPGGASLAGFSFLVDKYNIPAYVRFPFCVSHEHIRGTSARKGIWCIYDKRYWPGNGDMDHIVFALKYESFDLLTLKRIFSAVSQKELVQYISSKPTGIYARTIFFLYEWLFDSELDLPDCPKCQTKPLLNPDKYFTSAGIYLKRYRLKNNLLGSKLFSPIIRKTPLLLEFIRSDLKNEVTKTIGKVSLSLVARAASFMLLSDSKASFAIEGERVPINRIERWGTAVMQAGKFPLSKEEFSRLQNIIIKDRRFTNTGLRKEGVFLGERDIEGNPLPEFIGARPDDLNILIDALIEADDTLNLSGIDPVLHAAAIAFGFVYIHPLEDGNGRLHRYLIHHVLAERGFSPIGLVFPVSSAMLNSIEEYKSVLQNHSNPLMDLIEWQATDTGNVRVLNESRDLYSYFDCTEACEYLYKCVKETIIKDLPEELHYLKCHDKALTGISNLFDIPDNMVKSLIVFIRQNDGVLAKKRRQKEFAKLTDSEIHKIEAIVNSAFELSK
jgi:hypothetical protein